jgi:predicted ATPase
VPPTIFINYRREDASGYAGRLADSLRAALGEEAAILRDVDGMIDPGEDFRRAIARALDEADVLLAVIGRRWLGARDTDGTPRLAQERDLVRLELLDALERGLEVIPVLVEQAEMPDEAALPDALKPLATRNAFELSDGRWATDCERLAEVISSHAGGAARATVRPIPTPPTALLGREDDLDAVAQALERGVRLMTLTGPGGIGKTRVAIEAANRARERFEKLVFCDVATLDDPALVPAAIARAAEIEEAPEDRLLDTIARALGSAPSLLVIDNFEHLVQAGPTVAELLRLAPALQVLVTSRVALRISGDHELPIGPLSGADAMRLFTERARGVRPDLDLTATEAEALAEICRRLDGLPLAIELAAARVRLLSPVAMLDHLGRRLALLTHGAQDLPERQQTVRATIDWSYQLLDEPERALLARMSVFAGGAHLAAIQEVCAPSEDAIEVLNRVQLLAENSLIFVREDEAGNERFRMLELVHEFGWELVVQEGEGDKLRRRHAEYFGRLADRLGESLESVALVASFAGFDADYANLIASLEWARGHHAAELELGLLGWLGNYWYLRGSYAESWPWFEHALALDGTPPARRAAVLLGAGNLRSRMGDTNRAIELFGSSLNLYEEVGDLYGQARSLAGLEGCYARTEDYAAAERTETRVMEIVRVLGDRERLAFVAANAGYTAMQRNDLARARELFDESLVVASELGHPEAIANAEQNRGLLALVEGDLGLATRLTASGLQGSLELREHLGIVAGLIGAAALLAKGGEPTAAAEIIALTDAELGVRGYVLDPVEAQVRDETLELLRAELDPEQVDAALTAGASAELFSVARRTLAALRQRGRGSD